MGNRLINMKRNLLLLIMMLCVAFGSFAAVQRYEKDMGEFTHVRVLDALNVDVVCDADSAGRVVFFAEDNAVSRIIFENNSKGRLTIQADNVNNPVKLPRIKVFVKDLESVENSNDSTVTADFNNKHVLEAKIKTSGNGAIVARNIDAALVNASISTGKGRLELSGKCDKLDASNVGKGEIMAADLTATEVSSRIVGTGIVTCTVNGGELYLRGSGTGKLYYNGSPSKVTVKKLGSLKAIPLMEGTSVESAE